MRRSKKFMFLIILLMMIGFAAVSTTLVINGTFSIATKDDDFVIIFTKAVVDKVDVSTSVISEDGKSITFETKNLSKKDDYSVLQFEVTNSSTQYDANIVINCEGNGDYSEYYSIYQSIPSIVYAKSKDTGKITVTLTKTSTIEMHESFTCTIEASAIERDVIAEESEEVLLAHSMYSWRDIPLLSINLEATVDVLNGLDIDYFYHSFGSENLVKDQTKRIVSDLSNIGMETYFLTGHSSWYNNFDAVKSKIDEVYNYNLTAGDSEKIKGLTIDIEAYLNDEYKADIPTGFVTYANTVEQIYTYSKSKGLDVVIVLPYWFDTSYFSSTSSYTEEEKNNMEEAYRKIFMNADRISLMNYYKTNMVNAISYEMNLAKEVEVEIESIGEFSRPSGTDIPKTVSLWVEDDPVGYANDRWAEIQTAYNYSSTSYAYHDLEALLEINRLYKNNTFEIVDREGTTLNIAEILIAFDSGEKETVYTSRAVALPVDRNYDYYIYGYNILSETVEDVGDNSIKTTLVVEKAESYTLEIYPKLYNGTAYAGISSGKITLISDLFEVEKSKDINTGGYAAISNVYSNIEYKVIVEDVNGNSYIFETATSKNDNSEIITISDEKGNIVIPQGLKTNLYAVSTFYIK